MQSIHPVYMLSMVSSLVAFFTAWLIKNGSVKPEETKSEGGEPKTQDVDVEADVEKGDMEKGSSISEVVTA